jgi:histone H3/H4
LAEGSDQQLRHKRQAAPAPKRRARRTATQQYNTYTTIVRNEQRDSWAIGKEGRKKRFAIKRLPFSRLVREVAQDMTELHRKTYLGSGMEINCISKDAFETLQEATEDFCIKFLAASYVHALENTPARTTLQRKHMRKQMRLNYIMSGGEFAVCPREDTKAQYEEIHDSLGFGSGKVQGKRKQRSIVDEMAGKATK